MQWKVPNDLPAPLPPDGSVCNEVGTLCLVNADDWANLHSENLDLKRRQKTVQCASVTIIEASKGY